MGRRTYLKHPIPSCHLPLLEEERKDGPSRLRVSEPVPESEGRPFDSSNRSRFAPATSGQRRDLLDDSFRSRSFTVLIRSQIYRRYQSEMIQTAVWNWLWGVFDEDLRIVSVPSRVALPHLLHGELACGGFMAMEDPRSGGTLWL